MLISTSLDYARFLQMLLNGGSFEGTRILSEHSIELMTQNQIGELFVKELFNGFPLGSGRDKFGYGFKIASLDTVNPALRSQDSFSWAGSNTMFFWVDPKCGIAAVLLMHYLPFHDKAVLMVHDGFKRRIYESLN